MTFCALAGPANTNVTTLDKTASRAIRERSQLTSDSIERVPREWVLLDALEVAAAAQQQVLFEATLEDAVARRNVA